MAGSLILPLVLLLGCVGGLIFAPSEIRIPLIVLAGLVLVLAAAMLAWARARYRRWTFELTDEWLEARWGVLSRHTIVVPRNRVQTISLNHGPVDRFLDLESIVIHTAGSFSPNLLIPHVRPATVRWLKQELGTGLGEIDAIS